MKRALPIAACAALALSAHGAPLATMCTSIQELQNTSDGSAWTNACAQKRIILTASETSNSTLVFANITGLTWAAAAGTRYTFFCSIIFQSTATTTGIALAVANPGGLSSVDVTATYQGGTGNAAAPVANMMRSSHNVAFSTGTPTPSVPVQDTSYSAIVEGTLATVGSAGTAAIQLVSEVDTSAVKVMAGSWCWVY